MHNCTIWSITEGEFDKLQLVFNNIRHDEVKIVKIIRIVKDISMDVSTGVWLCETRGPKVNGGRLLLG